MNMKRTGQVIAVAAIAAFLTISCRASMRAIPMAYAAGERDSTLLAAAAPAGARAASERGEAKGDAAKNAAQTLEADLVYRAQIGLIVRDIESAQIKAVEAVRGFGGWIQRQDSEHAAFRVPCKSFEAAVEAICALGTINRREIEVEDVGKAIRDTEARLKNAEAVRDRLVKFLDLAANVKDALEVQGELGKVTELIEQLKAEVAAMKKDVAYSIISVTFNVPAEPKRTFDQRLVLGKPFPWITGLGLPNLLSLARDPGTKKADWELPENFADLGRFSKQIIARAYSADDIVLAVKEVRNESDSKLSFWSRIIERELIENRGYAKKSSSDIKCSNLTGTLMVFGQPVAGRAYTYAAAVFIGKEYRTVPLIGKKKTDIFVIEYAGEESAVAKESDALRKIIETLTLE